MNIKYINRKALQAVALFFGLALTACSSDESTGSTATPQVVNITFTQPSANNKAASRMGFDGEGTGYWHQGDAISLYYYNSDEGEKFAKLTLTDGAGTSTATFTGTTDYNIDNAPTVVAFYPYNENNQVKSMYLPDSYSYNGVDHDYTYTDGGKSANMPMYSYMAGAAKTFGHFIPIGAVLAVKVDHLPAATGTVTVTANEFIAGNAEYAPVNNSGGVIYDSETGQPLITLELENGQKTVTFNYTNATPGQAGVFYLPLPPNDYTGVKVTVTGGDVTYTAGGDDGKSFTLERGHIKKLKVVTPYSVTVDGHTFVNLGLPSGTLWATTNVGATLAADYGNYYAWGETEGKEEYNTNTYKYYYEEGSYLLLSKYSATDKLTTLQAADDAATVNWGSYSCTPTEDQLTELLNTTYLTREWTTQTDSNGNAVNGYLFTSVSNGNTLFLPAAGRMMLKQLGYTGEQGFYWTNVLNSSNMFYANLLCISQESVNIDNKDRLLGYSVRPVIAQ